MAPRLGARVGHNGRMTKAPDFKLVLTRLIEPTGGPDVELATLEDAARFGGLDAVLRRPREPQRHAVQRTPA